MPDLSGSPHAPDKASDAPGGRVARPPRNASLDEAVARQIRAYPGTITYLDLVRKNKRDSAILVVTMILLAVAVGVAIGAASSLYVAAPSTQSSVSGVPSPLIIGALVGGLIALLISSGASVWAFNAGGNAILRMSHAHPVTREMDPELFNVVEELTIAGGLPMPAIYLIGDSAMNAFATGKDPAHAAVAITLGLRQKLTRDELQGVMAHELAHIRHYDIRFSMLMAVMVGLIATATDAFLRVTWHAGHMTRRSSRKGEGGAQAIILILALILAIIAPILARIIQMAYSRQREYLADAGAVELTRNPKGLADALRRLAADDEPLVDTANRGTAHMYIVNPLNKMRRNPHEVSGLLSSHPPLAKRIARLEALLR